jgi:endonuclease G
MEHPFELPRPKGEFVMDPRTNARVKHHDFTGSGYDRGHMTPNSAIAHCYGHDAQLETFLLSNICPQAPNLNQKVWEILEKTEFVYADRFQEIWVMDGPIFGDLNGETTGTLRSGIAVPRAFYKILIENHGGTLDACAVIMPQRVRGTELPEQFTTSIEEIEKETGLEFLWKVDAATRQRLKSRATPLWPAALN